jgi:hypothetical protein
VFIFKVHGILLLGELIDLVEAIHVELSDERGNVFMSKEVW